MELREERFESSSITVEAKDDDELVFMTSSQDPQPTLQGRHAPPL